MSNSRFKNDNDERHQYRKQMLFISKRFEIQLVKFEKFIYERVFVVNKVDDDCKTYRDAFEQDFISMNEINLRDYHAKNDILYWNDKFWMFVDVSLLIDLFRKIHEFRIFEHFEFNRMKNFLKRDYYWSKMRKTIRQYVRNCYECQRNKTFKNHQNDLLISLIIFIRRWKNISINFITKLFNVYDYNFICTIIDRLSMKRHYVLVRSKTKIRLSKSLSKYSFNTCFVFMICFSRLRQIEIFNSYCSFDRLFAKFCVLSVSFSSFFIQKSTNKSKESTKTLRDNCDNIAITCKTIEIFKCSWQSSLTTMRLLQRQNYSFFSSTKIFILVWVSRLILFRIQLRKSDFWSSKRKISSISCETSSITFVITQR